eukprot:symbB.v1.2.024478.t1/scaffold2322.1/size82342/6
MLRKLPKGTVINVTTRRMTIVKLFLILKMKTGRSMVTKRCVVVVTSGSSMPLVHLELQQFPTPLTGAKVLPVHVSQVS